MLIFTKEGLTYLATPETGTTALETVLRPKADIIFAKARKHITARLYTARVAPFLAATFGIETETVAVVRTPLDQIKSGYSYRARAEIKGTSRSTYGLSIDSFFMALTSDVPPEYARVGSQFRFLTDRQGNLAVDHLFAYEQQAKLLAFLSARLVTPVTPDPRNTSLRIGTPLSHEAAAVLGRARRAEFALYDRLNATGGYLTHP